MAVTTAPEWRPLEPSDRPAVRAMLDRSSPTSVFRRFFTLLPRDDDLVLRPILDVDHDAHEELVAVVGDQIVALAGYFRSRQDPTTADVAVIVEDAWQGFGLGRTLFGALGKVAWRRGITRFSGTILADNRPAIEFLRALAPELTLERDGAEVHFTVPLNLPMRAPAHAA
ncbi:MAG TPA: GNAT family N-acetyltransferase [Acidimicrobiia bacterium]|nr:GNAT family N-acetyltransferase [Acidimicrobiia bacterium]